MNSTKNTEKEIQKNLLEFIRLMDGLGPVGLSHLTHTTNNDRELAIFYLEPMVKKKWIISIRGHIENSYQMTKKGIDALEKMNVESAKRKLEGGPMDELITKETRDNKITKVSDIKTDLQKLLKLLYEDLLDAENGPDRNTFGFKHRLKVIHEDLQDVEMRICAEFGLGDFGVLPDFEPTHYRRGDSGMDQLLKSQIKRLAIEIGVNLEQENTITEHITSETPTKHHWTNKEKTGVCLGIVAIVFTILFSTMGANFLFPPEPMVTEQTLAKLLKSGNVEEFNKIKHNWTGKLNFDGINLSKMDLTEVDLRHTSLLDANFDNAILITAFFQGADLEQASFRNANLERANLVEANLKKAFLRGADLEQANLNRANMQDVNLYTANLRQASLIETELQNADLQHAEFYWADLRGANLEGAILNNTDFREVENFPISLEEAKARSAVVD